MNPPVLSAAARLLSEGNSVWAWAIAVTAIGLLIAALMVLVQDKALPPHRGAIWAIVIFAIPIFGPAAYLGWETIKFRSENGKHELGPVEKYAPEEAAQRKAEEQRERHATDGREKQDERRDDTAI